jgi:3-oxoacyl-[acyl-carrier-protein] synthase-1
LFGTNFLYSHHEGTSTPIGDLKELSAVTNVFARQGYQPNVGSTKSLSGHALGAAGVHEVLLNHHQYPHI